MIKILELFAGIGACSKALERLKIDYEIVDAVENDKFAIASFNAIHNTNFNCQDIREWDKDIDVDLIMHGSPCQDFSIAGKQAGGDKDSGTRSSLMYETLRIVKKLQPKYVIWENVKNILSKKHRHNFDAYLEAMEKLGYKNYYQVLNAKHYGVPQNRERVFTVSILCDKIVYDDYNSNIRADQDTIGTLTTNCGAQAPRNGWKIIEERIDFKFPEPQPLVKKLKDMLDNEVDEKYYLTQQKIDMISKWKCYEKPLEHIMTEDSISGTLTTRSGAECGGMKTIAIRTANKQGYDLATDGDSPNLKTKLCNKLVKEGVVQGGEIVNHSYTNSKQRNTLDKYIETKNGVMPTMTTRPDILGYVENNPVRIRKLTPKECWRLMGFDDTDFEKAAKVNSNAQLYKQAGNSIVVNVLEAILKNLMEVV